MKPIRIPDLAPEQLAELEDLYRATREVRPRTRARMVLVAAGLSEALHRRARVRVGRGPRPTAAIVDSRSVNWVPVDQEPSPCPDFTVLPRRWVVERTFSLIGQNLRMSKAYERLPDSSEAFIYVAMSRLMARRTVHL
jgi:transposase